MDTITQQVVDFLAGEVDMEPADLLSEASLFNSGLIDSVAVLSTVQFIEEVFDLELEPEQVTLDNFDSITAIVALVKSLRT